MQVIKVLDVNNSAYSYVTNEVKDNDLILVSNFNSLQRIYTTLIKHNRKISTAYSFRGFLEKVLNKKIEYGYKSLKRILALNFLPNVSSNTQKARAIDYLCMLYKCQKVLQRRDDAKYFNTFNKEGYLTLNDYIRFKELHDKYGVYTIEDAMMDAVNVGIKRSYDTVYVINYEDYAKLNYKVLENTIEANRLVLIGDENKSTNYTATKMPYKPNANLTISDVFYSSKKIIDLYNKLKVELKLPYNAVYNGEEGFYIEKDFTEQSVTYIKGKLFNYESAIVAYEHFLLAYQVENLLFRENVPFNSFLDEYKFPKTLYNISNTMIRILNNNDYVTIEEVRNIIKHLHPRLISKFGGMRKLMNTYTVPMFSSSVIGRDKLFAYLKKCWIDRNFNAVLEPETSKQYQMWKYRLKQEWLSPKIRTGLLTNLKCCNVDIVVYIYSSDKINPKDLYTALTMARVGVYALKIKGGVI